MAHKASGKHFRKGLPLIETARMFPDNAAAERRFVETHWPKASVSPNAAR